MLGRVAKCIRQKAAEFGAWLCAYEALSLWDGIDLTEGNIVTVNEPGLKLSFAGFGEQIAVAIETQKPLNGRFLNYIAADSQRELIDLVRKEYGISFDVCTECGMPFLGGFVSKEPQDDVHVCTHCMRAYMDRHYGKNWDIFRGRGRGKERYFVSKDSRKNERVSKIRYIRFNEPKVFAVA